MRYVRYGPYVVSLLNWTPISEWYMIRLVVLRGHHKGTCHDAIGLYAQHKDKILGLIVITIRRAYVIS